MGISLFPFFPTHSENWPAELWSLQECTVLQRIFTHLHSSLPRFTAVWGQKKIKFKWIWTQLVKINLNATHVAYPKICIFPSCLLPQPARRKKMVWVDKLDSFNLLPQSSDKLTLLWGSCVLQSQKTDLTLFMIFPMSNPNVLPKCFSDTSPVV